MSVTLCQWHYVSDTMSVTLCQCHNVSVTNVCDTMSVTLCQCHKCQWHYVSDTMSVSQCQWHNVSDAMSVSQMSVTLCQWHYVSDTTSVSQCQWSLVTHWPYLSTLEPGHNTALYKFTFFTLQVSTGFHYIQPTSVKLIWFPVHFTIRHTSPHSAQNVLKVGSIMVVARVRHTGSFVYDFAELWSSEAMLAMQLPVCKQYEPLWIGGKNLADEQFW